MKGNTWHLYDDQTVGERKWESLVYCTSVEQERSLYDLCHGRFNGCILDTGLYRYQGKEWEKEYKDMQVLTYEEFIKSEPWNILS